MELKEHLEILAIREKSKIGNVLGGYEVKDWPDGRRDNLIEMGMLIFIDDATTIKCPCCSKGCPVDPVKEIANDGTEYYEVLCEIEGSCDVEPIYVKQLQITEKIRKYLPKPERPAGTPEQTYIKKDRSEWMFGFNGETAKVKFKKELKGLALIEHLLTHDNIEYTPLKLLQAVGQRREGENPPEKIYTSKDIAKIKGAIAGLKGRREHSNDSGEIETFDEQIEKAELQLRLSRGCRGQSRNFSDKHRISVTRNIKTVLSKIAPQSTKLYNHLDIFLTRGELCHYKPDSDIVWNIS